MDNKERKGKYYLLTGWKGLCTLQIVGNYIRNLQMNYAESDLSDSTSGHY